MHKKLLSILALTILVTSTLVGCSGAPSTASTLTILSITEGDVFVMKAGTDDWTEATVEMSLGVGDTIKTGDDSGAEITFFDGSTIELEAGTQIEITSLDSSPDNGTKTITLMQTIGTTISRVTKLLDPASSYAIETPSGVAAVRGSIMIVRIVFDDPNYEDGTVLIMSVEGHIYWIGLGEELQLPEGAQVIADSETAQLVQLSLAVDDSATADEDTPVTFAAPGVLGNDSGLTVGDTLTVIAVDTIGTVGNVTAWDADGSFTYDPTEQFEGLEAGNATTDSFTYTVTDDYGITDTATVTITVNGVYDEPPYTPPAYTPPAYYPPPYSPPANHAPTAISLDSSSVAENQPANTTVGAFSTTDPDTDNAFTYTLVSGAGDTDNASFNIDDSKLKTSAIFDYETKNSYSIRVRSTDQGGLWFEKQFTITVTDVNEPPTNVSLSSIAVAQNRPVNTTVGTFSTTDPDIGDTFTYTLVSGAGDTDNGSFNIDDSNLRTSAVFDYETKNSYSIRVRSTDQGGLWVEKQFTITITDVNEPPTNISLSSSSAAENQPANTTVGAFSTTDPDTGNTFTYALVSGTGDMDNDSFNIDDSNLRTSAIFDHETKHSYSIRVRSTDQGALWFEKEFTITVTNVNETPVAENDTATTSQDTAVTIDVLNNDSDPDHDTLTVDSVTQGAHGSVTNNGGDVTYTPDDDFNGTDSFNYTISDGNGGTDTATVSVDILEPTVETVRFPDQGTAYVAYEDREAGDFDYNDFGMTMWIEETYIAGCLAEINMAFSSVVHDAGDSHDIHILRTFSGSTTYNYTITRSHPGTETPTVTNASGQGNFDIVLFDTSDFTSGDTVTIHIEITDGCERYSPTPWAYYDPYMNDYTAGTVYDVGDTQEAAGDLLDEYSTPYPVPYILVIPVSGWEAPSSCITNLYPYFDDYYATDSPADWYLIKSS